MKGLNRRGSAERGATAGAPFFKLLAQVPEFIVMGGDLSWSHVTRHALPRLGVHFGLGLGDEEMKFCEINTSEARTGGFGGLAPHNDGLSLYGLTKSSIHRSYIARRLLTLGLDPSGSQYSSPVTDPSQSPGHFVSVSQPVSFHIPSAGSEPRHDQIISKLSIHQKFHR